MFSRWNDVLSLSAPLAVYSSTPINFISQLNPWRFLIPITWNSFIS
ncbi:MAG: hypothetical protein ACRD8K_05040 [Nitrososphaeraceae archaeon]